LVIAGVVFIVSYSLHRKFTFVDIKYVGIALYLTNKEGLREVWNKIENYPDFIHVDIVDETYNPKAKRSEVNLKYGKEIKSRWFGIHVMTHIMSKYPSTWIESVAKFSDTIMIHCEIEENLKQIIKNIKLQGKKVGVSILFTSDIENILPYLSEVDTVQVLGIFQPGESGQHLERAALSKLQELNSIKDRYKFNTCFDGGVKRENINSIQADYVVSASSVLNADNPIDAIFDLKTSSRYFSQLSSLKGFLKKKILEIGEQVGYILSLNIVGSFSEKDEIAGISDIDIVILIDNLTKEKYDEIINFFVKLKELIETDYNLRVKVNNTFGPLKFDDIADVVLHLMIYDRKGHLEHCIKSPFTVLDWERSRLYAKRPMKEIIATFVPQPNQLINTRRGIETYLNDLHKSVITYRKYEINKSGVVKEITKVQTMSEKDKVEYVYHVMKFMMLNFMKIKKNDNLSFSDQLVEDFFNLTRIDFSYHSFFKEIQRRKTKKKIKINKNEILKLQNFLSELKESHNREFFVNSKSIVFIRHAKTKLNQEDVFLGQKNDLSIESNYDQGIVLRLRNIVEKSEKIYTSPLKRALETAYLINQKSKIEITINYDLNEIDYGLADGKSYNYLLKKYPKIILGWNKKKDMAFPDGENYGNLSKRLGHFIKLINNQAEKKIIVVTHNVVMRSIIGKILNIPHWQWHKIKIENLEDFEVLLLNNGGMYLNLDPDKISNIYNKIYED